MAIADELFETRTMLDAIDEREAFKPKSFLTSLAFTVGRDIEGEVLEIDIIKGARRIAPLVHAKHEGKKIEKRDYETREIKPPYIKMLDETNAADMMKRRPGETIYRPGVSAAQLAAERLGEQLQEFIEMIQRRIEVMAAEALAEGKITLTGEGFNGEIDFLRDANNDITLAGANLWDDADSDPPGNLLDWQDQISNKTGLLATKLVLGFQALKAFLKNAEVRALLDNRRIMLGQITREEVPEGAVYYGSVHGVDIFGYNERYLDEAGATQRFVAEKEALMVVEGARSKNKLHYGAIKDVEAGVVAVPFFPKSWVIENPSSRLLLVQSAPLVALHRPDTTLRAKVLA
jgi:hypothetical protein